jgi:hypothetical protein
MASIRLLGFWFVAFTYLLELNQKMWPSFSTVWFKKQALRSARVPSLSDYVDRVFFAKKIWAPMSHTVMRDRAFFGRIEHWHSNSMGLWWYSF